jgi:hypothetical protein
MNLRSSFFVLGLAMVVALSGCSSSSSSGPAVATTQFVGTVNGTNAVVGVVVTGDKALVFFCGTGSTLSTLTHWMHGSITVGQPFTVTDSTATASGTATATGVTGTLSVEDAGPPIMWSASVVASGTAAGVYTDQATQGLADLIVTQPTPSVTAMLQGAFRDSADGIVFQVMPLDDHPVDGAISAQVTEANTVIPLTLTLATAD